MGQPAQPPGCQSMLRRPIVIMGLAMIVILLGFQIFASRRSSGTQGGPPKSVVLSNVVPRNYIIFSGQGEADKVADAYDAALVNANLQDYALTQYSGASANDGRALPLPAEATEMATPTAPYNGSEVESVVADMSGKKGETLTAGIITAQVQKKGDPNAKDANLKPKKMGGFVAEYHGNGSEKDAEAALRQSIQHAFDLRYKSSDYELIDVKPVTKSFVPQKAYGTVLVVLGFRDYYYPQN